MYKIGEERREKEERKERREKRGRRENSCCESSITKREISDLGVENKLED